MRCNWYRQRPTQNVCDWAFLWMQHEKKLISHSAGRLWRKATSIELVCMRGGKLKYGLGLQMPASAIGCFGYGGWNVFSLCMCVSVCEWRHRTFLHLCYFPMTTLELGATDEVTVLREKVIFKTRQVIPHSDTQLHASPTNQTRSSSLTICHLDAFDSCMHAEFQRSGLNWSGPWSVRLLSATGDPAKPSEYELTA